MTTINMNIKVIEPILTDTDLILKNQTAVTPFQLFCFTNREKTSKLNPHLKGTLITSILAKAWKNLDQENRKHYEELSYSIRGFKSIFKEEKSKKNIHTSPNEFFMTEIPKISLFSRNNFGTFAFEASQKATKTK